MSRYTRQRPMPWVLFGCVILLACQGVDSFTLIQSGTTIRRSTTALCLVTEDDVIQAVEHAEDLWEKALEARKTANALSDRAEEEAEAAASNAEQVVEELKTTKSVSLENMAKADTIAMSSLDAGSMLNKALAANDEAEKLEALADEALKESQVKLDQHIKDFPESSLAEGE